MSEKIKSKLKEKKVGSDHYATATLEDENGVIEHAEFPVYSNFAESSETNAMVGFGSGITKNMGNYNSARVDVHLDLHCDVLEIEKVYEFSKGWVNAKLEEIVESKLKS